MNNYIDKLNKTHNEALVCIDNMLTGKSRTEEGFIELANALIDIKYNSYSVFPNHIAGHMWSSSGMYSWLSEINQGLKTCDMCFVSTAQDTVPMIIFKHCLDADEINKEVMKKYPWLPQNQCEGTDVQLDIYTSIERFISELKSQEAKE